MSQVVLKNIFKEFSGTKVLKDVSLEIKKGEFIVFVGPSGCGKSTLLRIIAGLEPPSTGSVLFDGEDVTQMPPAKRQVAMVFQNYALYPHMTVEENIGFGLKMASMPKDVIAKKTGEVSRVLQLESLMKRKPKELSGGQRQRVAMGRAMVRDPKIFLFDEPLSNLDAKLRMDMRREIHKLHKNLFQSTMIYVTHDQTEAMTMADKIVVLKDGQIEQIGTPLEIYFNPINKFVAGFIGAPKMNFMAATLVGKTKRTSTIKLPDKKIMELPVYSKSAAIGSKVTLGVRAEDLGGHEGEYTLKVSYDLKEHLGASMYLYGTYEDGSPIVVATHKPVRMDGGYMHLPLKAKSAFLFNDRGVAFHR